MPSETVAQSGEAYGGTLERKREIDPADKTSTTDNNSIIETISTTTSWSDKGEDEQRRTRGSDAAHAADGDVWDNHALLLSRASLAANLATIK